MVSTCHITETACRVTLVRFYREGCILVVYCPRVAHIISTSHDTGPQVSLIIQAVKTQLSTCSIRLTLIADIEASFSASQLIHIPRAAHQGMGRAMRTDLAMTPPTVCGHPPNLSLLSLNKLSPVSSAANSYSIYSIFERVADPSSAIIVAQAATMFDAVPWSNVLAKHESIVYLAASGTGHGNRDRS
jgi:hypothetical protein